MAESSGGGKPGGLSPTASTWVMRDANNELVRVRVKDMTDEHLYRWIQYFRRKWRDLRKNEGGGAMLNATDAYVDACLRVSMITAPAIYAEAASRLLIAPIGGNSPPPFANQPTMTGWAKSPAITIPAKNFVTPATKPAGTVIVSKGGKLRAVEPQPGDRLIELDDEE